MKGSLHTDELMGAVVSSQTGLRTAPCKPLLCHGCSRPRHATDRDGRGDQYRSHSQ